MNERAALRCGSPAGPNGYGEVHVFICRDPDEALPSFPPPAPARKQTRPLIPAPPPPPASFPPPVPPHPHQAIIRTPSHSRGRSPHPLRQIRRRDHIQPVIDIKRHRPVPLLRAHIVHQRQQRRPKHPPRQLVVVGVPRAQPKAPVADHAVEAVGGQDAVAGRGDVRPRAVPGRVQRRQHVVVDPACGGRDQVAGC